MAKKHINPQVNYLRRSIVNKFQFEEANSHPELKRAERKGKRKRVVTRREKRKLSKQLVKARRIAYSTKQPLEKLYADILHPKREPKKTAVVKNDEEISETATEKKRNRDEERKEKRMHEMRELIAADEKEIKTLSKRLKLNKRKSKSLPKSFVDEGLDYLLELCGSTSAVKADEEENESRAGSGDDELENDFSDSEEMLQSDFEDEETKPATDRSKKRVRFVDEKEVDETEDNKEENDEEEEEEEEENVSEESGNEDELKEDIYGRLRDKKGNVVRTQSLNQEISSRLQGDNETLKKLLKSIVNRLGESNVHNALTKISEVYQTNSRNDVKEIFTDTVFQSCIRPEKVPDRLLFEQCLLLALIHSKISSEITSYFIEQLALKLRSLCADLMNDVENKILDNIATMIAHLYDLKVIQCKLVFDVMKLFLKQFTEKCIEIILLLCQIVGSVLRKDNPTEFKSIVDEIRLKSTSSETKLLENQSRVKFMLESLQQLKSNNAIKYFDYDPLLAEHFMKVLRGLMSGKVLESPLSMGLADLWSASVNGRWWIVGSAVIVAPMITRSNLTTEKSSSSTLQFSESLLKLAKKNQMNTDLRRNVFCILMSSEDYLDAFEKLTKLSLKDQQEREIIHIALNCCLKEKIFNPFYVYLIQKFCTHQPRFTVNQDLTTQFAIWDKLKILDELKNAATENLALLLSHLVISKTLSLTVLKVIDFVKLSENSLKLLTIFFKKFLLDSNEDNLRTIFANCLLKKKFQGFLEGVKLFLHQDFPNRITEDNDATTLQRKINRIDKYFYYSLDNSLM